MWIATESIWNRNNWASIRKKKKKLHNQFLFQLGNTETNKTRQLFIQVGIAIWKIVGLNKENKNKNQ